MSRSIKVMSFMLAVSAVAFSMLLQVSVSNAAEPNQVVNMTLEPDASQKAVAKLFLPVGSSIVASHAHNSSDCAVHVELQGNNLTAATLSVTEGIVKMSAMQTCFFDICAQGDAGPKFFEAPLGNEVTVKATWSGENGPCPLNPGKLLVSLFFTTAPGTVKVVQGGPWTVGIDPAQNVVEVAPHRFSYHPTFDVIGGDGSTIDIGPFDLSNVSKLRLIARAFNNNGGDIRFQVFAWDSADPFKRIVFDDFLLFEAFKTTVYPAVPPLVLVRLTKVGGTGANYHLVLIGTGD